MPDLMSIALGALALLIVQGVGVIIAVLIDAQEGKEAATQWWFITGWLLWMPAAVVWTLWQIRSEHRARRWAWKAMGPPATAAQVRAMHERQGRTDA